jgi:hypothetical protein
MFMIINETSNGEKHRKYDDFKTLIITFYTGMCIICLNSQDHKMSFSQKNFQPIFLKIRKINDKKNDHPNELLVIQIYKKHGGIYMVHAINVIRY